MVQSERVLAALVGGILTIIGGLIILIFQIFGGKYKRTEELLLEDKLLRGREEEKLLLAHGLSMKMAIEMHERNKELAGDLTRIDNLEKRVDWLEKVIRA